MSIQARKLESLRKKIAKLHRREKGDVDFLKKTWSRLGRWSLMLTHEFVRDDVKIRAQSMAFLMIFSFLPLLAGAFFIFTIFAQFGMVQDALSGFTERFLTTIPFEHRGFVQDYILHFKESYLASISQKSGSVGIFALVILIWVGLQTFANVDTTLNHIWGSDKSRPWIERFRNFVFIAIVAPIVLIGGLSVPLILKRIAVTQFLFSNLPFLSVLLNFFIPVILLFSMFVLMYRYIPVQAVSWRASAIGAFFATMLLQTSNLLIDLYFRFGTNSAYGKAAIVPLIGFWIYVVWIVVILGAEASFLVDRGSELLSRTDSDPGFYDAEALLSCLVVLNDAHKNGKGPVSMIALQSVCEIGGRRLSEVIEFLRIKGFIVDVQESGRDTRGAFSLGKDLSKTDLKQTLLDFFNLTGIEHQNYVCRRWWDSVDAWLEGFEKVSISEFFSEPPTPKKKRS